MDALLWMCTEGEVEGLRMVGEIGEDVPKGVGSGDCGNGTVESC